MTRPYGNASLSAQLHALCAQHPRAEAIAALLHVASILNRERQADAHARDVVQAAREAGL
jgi:hypothetical protein